MFLTETQSYMGGLLTRLVYIFIIRTFDVLTQSHMYVYMFEYAFLT